MHEKTREDPRAVTRGRPPEPDFDLAWARSSPTHELSAHGRSVQRRLDTPAVAPAHPSWWKRLRFTLYRWRNRR